MYSTYSLSIIYIYLTRPLSLQVIIVNRLVLNLSYTANSDGDATYRSGTNLTPPLIFAPNHILGDINALASSNFIGNFDEEFDEADETDVGISSYAGLDEGDFESPLVDTGGDGASEMTGVEALNT